MPGSSWFGREEDSCICYLFRLCVSTASAKHGGGSAEPKEGAGVVAPRAPRRRAGMSDKPVQPIFRSFPLKDAIAQLNAFIASAMVVPCTRPKASYFDTEHPERIDSSVRNIEDYVERVAQYSAKAMVTTWSSEVLCIAAIYMRRLAHQYGGLTDHNVHRFTAIAIWVACKFHLDTVTSVAYFSNISGIGVTEIRRCEKDFLSRIDFRLWVGREEFDSACSEWEYLISLQPRKTKPVPIRIENKQIGGE